MAHYPVPDRGGPDLIPEGLDSGVLQSRTPGCRVSGASPRAHRPFLFRMANVSTGRPRPLLKNPNNSVAYPLLSLFATAMFDAPFPSAVSEVTPEQHSRRLRGTDSSSLYCLSYPYAFGLESCGACLTQGPALDIRELRLRSMKGAHNDWN